MNAHNLVSCAILNLQAVVFKPSLTLKELQMTSTEYRNKLAQAQQQISNAFENCEDGSAFELLLADYTEKASMFESMRFGLRCRLGVALYVYQLAISKTVRHIKTDMYGDICPGIPVNATPPAFQHVRRIV